MLATLSNGRTLVNDAPTRLKPVRVVDHLMAFTCRRLRRGFRRGSCNVVATLPVNVDPKTFLPLTSSIHHQNRPDKRRPALTLSPSEGNSFAVDPGNLPRTTLLSIDIALSADGRESEGTNHQPARSV
jgi:hypothetical protein